MGSFPREANRRLPFGAREGGFVSAVNGDGRVWSVYRGDALDAYPVWPSPSAIVSDGAYGVGGFPGDPRTPEDLAEWYASHLAPAVG